MCVCVLESISDEILLEILASPMLRTKIERVLFTTQFWKLGVYGEESCSKNLSVENLWGVLWESPGTRSGKTSPGIPSGHTSIQTTRAIPFQTCVPQVIERGEYLPSRFPLILPFTSKCQVSIMCQALFQAQQKLLICEEYSQSSYFGLNTIADTAR